MSMGGSSQIGVLFAGSSSPSGSPLNRLRAYRWQLSNSAMQGFDRPEDQMDLTPMQRGSDRRRVRTVRVRAGRSLRYDPSSGGDRGYRDMARSRRARRPRRRPTFRLVQGVPMAESGRIVPGHERVRRRASSRPLAGVRRVPLQRLARVSYGDHHGARAGFLAGYVTCGTPRTLDPALPGTRPSVPPLALPPNGAETNT